LGSLLSAVFFLKKFFISRFASPLGNQFVSLDALCVALLLLAVRRVSSDRENREYRELAGNFISTGKNREIAGNFSTNREFLKSESN